MTGHIELIAVVRPNSSTTKRVRLADVNRCGGLIHRGPYEAVARKISYLPWCERVVATLVRETNVGTWRRGQKS